MQLGAAGGCQEGPSGRGLARPGKTLEHILQVTQSQCVLGG